MYDPSIDRYTNDEACSEFDFALWELSYYFETEVLRCPLYIPPRYFLPKFKGIRQKRVLLIIV
jgi:hypothetical protein